MQNALQPNARIIIKTRYQSSEPATGVTCVLYEGGKLEGGWVGVSLTIVIGYLSMAKNQINSKSKTGFKILDLRYSLLCSESIPLSMRDAVHSCLNDLSTHVGQNLQTIKINGC